MSRKIHFDEAGYVAERKNRHAPGKVVIHLAGEQGFDSEGAGKYMVSCDAHHTLVFTTSVRKARAIMKSVDFCEACMENNLE